MNDTEGITQTSVSIRQTILHIRYCEILNLTENNLFLREPYLNVTTFQSLNEFFKKHAGITAFERAW